MKQMPFAFLSTCILLVACAPAASTQVASTATLLPTATALPTVTALPTSTPTMTATPANTPAPTATLAPTATPRLQARVITDTVLHEGPSNFGYKELAALPRGAQVTLLAVFRDFYQVQWTDSKGTSTGYVLANQLGNIGDASKIPAIAADTVPWQQLKTIIGVPYTFSGRENGYTQHPIPGGTFLLNGDAKIDFDFNIVNQGTLPTPSTNFALTIGSNGNVLNVSREGDKWALKIYKKGAANSFLSKPFNWPDGNGKFSFIIKNDGKTIVLIDAQGNALVKGFSVDPSVQFFDAKDTVVEARIQTPPGSTVTLNALSISAKPSGKELAQAPNINPVVNYPPLPNTHIPTELYHGKGPVQIAEAINKPFRGDGSLVSMVLPQSAMVNNGALEIAGILDNRPGKEKTGTLKYQGNTRFVFYSHVIGEGSGSMNTPQGWTKFYETSDIQIAAEGLQFYINLLQGRGITDLKFQVMTYPDLRLEILFTHSGF